MIFKIMFLKFYVLLMSFPIINFSRLILIMPTHPVTLVMGWIGSLSVHLGYFSFAVHYIFDC